MTKGLIVTLEELIALKRYPRRSHDALRGLAQQAGHHLSRLRGRGMDFSETRHYQAGDDIRHMEWRVTARTGSPHIKLYEEEKERPVMIVVDFSPSMYFGTRGAFKSVVAAKLAALIAWTVIRQGDRVGALLFSAKHHNEFTPKSRDSGVLPLMAALSDYTAKLDMAELSSTVCLSDELQRLRRVTRPGSVVVLISDFYQMNTDCEKQLQRLSAHNDVIAWHVCDALECAPPKPGLYAMSNGQQQILLDTRDKRIYQDYLAWCDARHVDLQVRLKRLRIPCTQINATDDMVSLVRRHFPRRTYG